MTVSASLVAGNEYILGAGYYSDAGGDWFRNTATVNPSFVLKQDLYSDGSGPLSLPTDGYFNNGVNSWYGPNLEAAVPEGGMTAALLGIGMVALGWVRRSSK